MSILTQIQGKLEILTRILHVFAYALLRGAAKVTPNNPRTILVVQAAKLGDMVCTTPVFRAIKTRYPNSTLIVAGNKINQTLLEGDRFIEKYLIMNDNISRDARTYREFNIDVAIIFNPSFTHSAACFLGKIGTIIVPAISGGYSSLDTLSFRCIRRLMRTFPIRFGHYAPQEYLGALSHLDIDSRDTRKELPVSEAARTAIRAYLLETVRSDFLVGISVSPGNKIKQWPEERFAMLIDHICSSTQAQVIMTGSKADIDQVRKTVTLVSDKTRILDTAGLFELDELKALIAELDMFISVDTGPVYIAEAFNVPTIDIIGPMDEYEQPPTGPLNVLVIPPRTNPAIHLLNARPVDTTEARMQVENTSVEMVARAFDELYSRLRV